MPQVEPHPVAATLDGLIAQLHREPEARDRAALAALAAALRDMADAEIGPAIITPGVGPIDSFTLTAIAIYLAGARRRLESSGSPDVYDWRELRLVGHALAEHYRDQPPEH